MRPVFLPVFQCCAQVILDARSRHSPVDLFIRLGWLPFNLESDIKKCILAYKRTISEIVSITAEGYVREREAGRSFTVTACKLWDNLSLKFKISAFKKVCIGIFILFKHKQFLPFQNCNFYLLSIRYMNLFAYHC